MHAFLFYVNVSRIILFTSGTYADFYYYGEVLFMSFIYAVTTMNSGISITAGE